VNQNHSQDFWHAEAFQTTPALPQERAQNEADRIERLFHARDQEQSEAALQAAGWQARREEEHRGKLALIARHEVLDQEINRRFWKACIPPLVLGLTLGIFAVACFGRRF
jgi:hypothetical protein